MKNNPRYPDSNNDPPNGNLPPLPERTLKGIPEGAKSEFDNAPFHTVHVWEFTNLYVLLNTQMWETISTFLRSDKNLTAVAYMLDHGPGTLFAIRKNPNQSIHISMLKAIVHVANLDYDLVERSLRAVKFGQRGEPEKVKFPFSMDLYAWRVICHVTGDGNVAIRKDRPCPYLRWTQKVKFQKSMRKLIKYLSREVGGSTMNVNYPKVLSYAIMGTMPAIRIFDLKRPKFLQFILDLPEKYRKYKVQFLAAFIVDDGSIFGDISFCQKDPVMLTHIIQLCDHLGYDHSPLYRQERDGVHSFQLNQNGIQQFYNELQQLSSYDSCLNLWHKQEKLITLASSFSGERKDEQNHALALCIRILEILEDKKKYTTKDLWNHPELKLFTHEYPYYLFRRKIRLLKSRGAIKEIKKINKTSYRPKKWQINQNETSAKIVEEFKENYNKRTHKQKYKRRRITVEMVEEAIPKLQKQGIQRPGALAVSQEIGCSKKQLYTRKDLRKFIVDD